MTANTSDQLRTKTWGELAKWHRLAITRDMFEYHGGKGQLSLVSTEQPQIWRCDGLTCREENSKAFAGLRAVLYLRRGERGAGRDLGRGLGRAD